MVRLYKALCDTGASVRFMPSRKHKDEIKIIFWYRDKKQVTSYSLTNLDEDYVIQDLYRFVRYIDCLEGDFVCC